MKTDNIRPSVLPHFFTEPSSSTVDTFHYERDSFNRGFLFVGGIDEAGRGPLAGPVVASCVYLPHDCNYRCFNDSKKLTPKRRQYLFDFLYNINGAAIGSAIVEPAEIDRINILRASLLAMKLAVEDLSKRNPITPDYLLVDGKFNVPIALPQKTLIKGESKSASIAAASIVAKVMRDRIMEDYDARFPDYNFKKNKGYPTREHRQAISKHGPCEIHRKTFKGVREYVNDEKHKTFITNIVR